MTTSLDVAKYFLWRAHNEAGEGITQLKLYKLVYYAQAWSLVFRGKSLFEGEVQAWSHGAIPVSLRPVFQVFGDEPIPPDYLAYFSPSKLSLEESELKVLDAVFTCYGSLTPGHLRNLSHAEQPWLIARGDLPEHSRCSTPINEGYMRLYYSSFVSSDQLDSWTIPQGVVSLTKKALDEECELYLSKFESEVEQIDSGNQLDSVPPEIAEKIEFIANNADKSRYKNKEDRRRLAEVLASYTD